MEQKNRFAMLNAINVSEHIQKKNGMNYLSWAWAWTEFKKIFPESFYTIYEQNGINYFSDGKTCYVKTGVTLVDGDYSLELIEELPVMDFKNKSLPLSAVTSMDVNKSIQRSITKAIARHGLGCYLYAGEDIPWESEEEKAAKLEAERKLQSAIKELVAKVDTEFNRITESMDKTEKIKYLDEVIVPILGQKNYKASKDIEKLSALFNVLSAA